MHVRRELTQPQPHLSSQRVMPRVLAALTCRHTTSNRQPLAHVQRRRTSIELHVAPRTNQRRHRHRRLMRTIQPARLQETVRPQPASRIRVMTNLHVPPPGNTRERRHLRASQRPPHECRSHRGPRTRRPQVIHRRLLQRLHQLLSGSDLTTPDSVVRPVSAIPQRLRRTIPQARIVRLVPFSRTRTHRCATRQRTQRNIRTETTMLRRDRNRRARNRKCRRQAHRTLQRRHAGTHQLNRSGSLASLTGAASSLLLRSTTGARTTAAGIQERSTPGTVAGSISCSRA